MTTSTPNSDQRRPARETVDVSILREIARNSLVHALNSVSRFLLFSRRVTVVNLVGQRCKDTRARPISCRATQLGHRGISAPSIHHLSFPFFDVAYGVI